VSNRTGGAELHAANVHTGEVAQLTRGANVFLYGWAIAPDDRSVLYVGGPKLDEFHLVDMHGGRGSPRGQVPPAVCRVLPVHHRRCSDGDTFYMCTNTRPTLYPSNLLVAVDQPGHRTPFFSERGRGRPFSSTTRCCAPRTRPSCRSTRPTGASSATATRPSGCGCSTSGRGRCVRCTSKKGPAAPGSSAFATRPGWPTGSTFASSSGATRSRSSRLTARSGGEPSWCAGKGPNFWHVSANPARRCSPLTRCGMTRASG